MKKYIFVGLVCWIGLAFGDGDGDALYKQGAAVFKENPARAFKLFVQAAEADNVSAMVGAGHCYETGTGTTVDYAKAIEWYQLAVEYNSIKACEGLARIYASCPDPSFHNGDQAVKYATVVVRKSPRDVAALSLLAAAHARNLNFELAKRTQNDAVRNAKLGQVEEARSRLADYEAGKPAPPIVSDEWVFKGADKNIPWALYRAGVVSQKKQDDTIAVDWYTKAVAAGSPEAAMALADCYWQGIGTSMNYIKAAEYYTIAEAAGQELEAFRAKQVSYFRKIWERLEHKSGKLCYEEGQRSEAMLKEILDRLGKTWDANKIQTLRATSGQRAMYCYAIAWAKGYAEAEPDYKRVRGVVEVGTKSVSRPSGRSSAYETARDYHYGRNGCEKNAAKALEFYQQAANEGVAVAYGQMGRIYRVGSGVPKDLPKAIDCYKKGFDAGDYSCATALGWLYQKGSLRDEQKELQWFLAGAEHDVMTSLSELAWYYGANKDPAKRDPEKAVHYAERTLKHKPTAFLTKNAMAAGYARGGKFKKAVKLQQEVVDYIEEKYSDAKHDAYRTRFRKRLELYKQNKPFPADGA